MKWGNKTARCVVCAGCFKPLLTLYYQLPEYARKKSRENEENVVRRWFLAVGIVYSLLRPARWTALPSSNTGRVETARATEIRSSLPDRVP